MSLTATNAQVYKGAAAVTYGSGPGDPTTVLLMHCDGTNGGTSFTDSSSYNQTITNAGSVVTSTAAQKFGTASFYTNGTAGNYYLSITSSALMFGTGDFTIEFWMNPSDPASTTRNQRLMGNLPLGSYNSGAWAIGFNTGDSGRLHIDINNVINGWTATTAQVAGTWYHITLARSGSTWYFFQNGVLQSTTTSSASLDNGGAARPVYIGWSGYSTTIANEYYNGYLDEIRFTYGKALYTSNFTVATSPFTISSTTTLSLPGAIGSYFLLPPTHPVNYDPSTSNVFVEAWVYWSGSSWTAGGQTGGAIYEKENAGGTVQDFGLYVDSAQKLTAYMYTQNGNILRPIYTTALSVQRWYHVAFGYNTVNQTAYVWVNGQVGTTSTASNPARYSVTYTYIGNNPFNAPTVYAWLGYIQDLRVTRGGVIPVTTFTPGSAPFGLASPSYVSGGTTVLSLATQYYQTAITGPVVSINATGGTITYANGYKIHTFTNVGTSSFTVNSGSAPARVLIVAGGGGSGGGQGGAGGGGGVVYYANQSFTPAGYTVTVGNGGAGGANFNTGGSNGGNSSVTGLTAAVGGGGGGGDAADLNGKTGGSGGGSGAEGPTSGTAGAGTAGQGNSGGIGSSSGPNYGGGAGGGAGGVGANGTGTTGGAGGIGVAYSISGTSTFYGGGGGGGTYAGGTAGTGGSGGGGNGAAGSGSGQNGAANTGGGGGAGGEKTNGILSNGGSGIVIISYPFSIEFTNRPPLTPVLTNPGTLQLTVGQVVTISQTANQPANGITWTFGPTGTGLNLTSTTDYGMTLTVASGVTSTLFTVRATNRAGLTTVVQFVAGSGLYSMTYPFTFTNMSATGANGPTSITYGSSNPGFGTGYAMVLGSGTSTGMQRWTVPESGSYTFTVAGAGVQHLNNTSGPPYNVNYISYGAVGTSTIALTAGHVLRILVGQQGTRGQSGVFARCGGCGGSFVYNETTSTLLLAAGGGGGHGGDPGGATLGAGTTGDPYRNGTGKGDDAQLGTSGSVGRDGNGGTAGINGAGGGGNTQGYGGDGGAGFNGNGNVNTANGNSVTAAKAFINGGNGAIGGNSPGGFGGGGSGGSNGGAGAGGGGGYSGGGGGANQGNGEGGGGGGSYTVGTFTSSSATNLGMGYVIVTR